MSTRPSTLLPLASSLLVLAFTGAQFCTRANADAVVSDFSSGTDGWLLSGDTTTATPDLIATGGDPGAFIRGFDTAVGGVWYFRAPGKFLGDRTASYGQTLQYSLRQRGSGSLFNSQDVILEGAGLTLRLINTPPVPSSSPWTQYSAQLDETVPWTLSTGGAPSQAQFQSVLGDLQSLRIRGEFITGSDNGDLDSVVLNAIPEPSSLSLLSLSFLMLYRRRRSL